MPFQLQNLVLFLVHGLDSRNDILNQIMGLIKEAFKMMNNFIKLIREQIMVSFNNTFAVCLMATDVSILAFTFGMTYCFRFFCNVLYEIIVKDFKSFYQGFGIRDFWLLVLKKKTVSSK